MAGDGLSELARFRQSVAETVPAVEARVSGDRPTRREWHRCGVTRSRDHRIERDAERGAHDQYPPGAQTARPSDIAGRFRNWILLTQLPQAISDRSSQARPVFRARHDTQSRG